jgi:hypothetical protein
MFDFLFGKSDKGFPLVIKHERKLRADYNGYIYIWDIDGTYLDTKLDSKRAIMKTAFEKAIEKKNIPGSDELIRALRKGYDDEKDQLNPLFFITASPPELENAITQKMRLDGVQYDGITYKSFLGLMERFSFSHLTQQYAYKLNALLDNRLKFPTQSKEVLFGDNYENDADIYSLYAQLIDEKPNYFNIKKRLREKVQDDIYVDDIMEKVRQIESSDDTTVKSIYIHLTSNKTTIDDYKDYPEILIPIRNFFEASARLYEDKHISFSSVKKVMDKILTYPHQIKTSLIDGIKDFASRGYIQEVTLEGILD